MADAPHLTPEFVVVDGANAVGGAPRQGFPGAGPSLALSLAVAVAVAVALRTRLPRVILVSALVLGGLPGLWRVLVVRPDAPHRRAGVAAVVESGLDDFARVRRFPQAPDVTRDDGDVLFPLARYAWPARPPADGGLELELRGSSLTTACHRSGDTGQTVCGVGP